MRGFASAIAIRATPSAVWALLTDAGGYTDWNSTIEKVVGRIAAGAAVTVYAKATPGRAFPVKVTVFDPPRRMVWTGGMPLGLFTGTRHFALTPQPDGTVEFTMAERYLGLLAPLIARAIPNLQPAFDTFAADLKRRAERANE